MSVPPLKTLFGSIANAIRSKKGTSAPMVASDFPQEILSIPTGGGSPNPPSEPMVTWIYRDMVTGEEKIVKTSVAKGGTAIPPSNVGNVQSNAGKNPALTFQGWNHSNQEMQNVQRDMTVGAMYVTTDGWTYLYVSLNPVTGLSHTLNVRSTAGNTVTIEWGDGTPDNTFTGTGSAQTHTYANFGTYVVKIKVTSGSGNLLLGGASNTTSVWGTNIRNQNDALFAVFIGTNTQLNNYAFYFTKIRSASIPSGVTSVGQDTFNDCRSLTAISIPAGVTSIGSSAFYNCFSLISTIFHSIFPPTMAHTTSFSGISALSKIYVPDASLNDYKTATNWVTYANRIHPISELTA